MERLLSTMKLDPRIQFRHRFYYVSIGTALFVGLGIRQLRLMYLRDAAILRLILFTGLRVGEIVKLRLNDVFIDERKGIIFVREGKGIKRREVPLNLKPERL